MSKKPFVIWILAVVSLILTGCMAKDNYYEPNPGYSSQDGVPRLIIQGTVRDQEGTGIPGIYVSVYGVREENEQDILTYNYAITDSAGMFTIIRYRGRAVPAEVTVVATDPNGVYEEQVLFVPVEYQYYTSLDSSHSTTSEPTNGFATADFTLTSSL